MGFKIDFGAASLWFNTLPNSLAGLANLRFGRQASTEIKKVISPAYHLGFSLVVFI
jgi:hypothetical protein